MVYFKPQKQLQKGVFLYLNKFFSRCIKKFFWGFHLSKGHNFVKKMFSIGLLVSLFEEISLLDEFTFLIYLKKSFSQINIKELIFWVNIKIFKLPSLFLKLLIQFGAFFNRASSLRVFWKCLETSQRMMNVILNKR